MSDRAGQPASTPLRNVEQADELKMNKPLKKHRLKNLVINELSLVTPPANQASHIILTKSDTAAAPKAKTFSDCLAGTKSSVAFTRSHARHRPRRRPRGRRTFHRYGSKWCEGARPRSCLTTTR